MSDTPTFTEWLDKYCHEPELVRMYYTKRSHKRYSERELIVLYKQAFKRSLEENPELFDYKPKEEQK